MYDKWSFVIVTKYPKFILYHMNTSFKINIFMVVGVIVVIGIIGGFWYRKKSQSLIEPQEQKEEVSLGAEIFDKTQNPLEEKLPETNPFAADTNPFDTNTNPFRSEYKNPFK